MAPETTWADQPQIEDGILDLSSEDLSQGTINLSGDWKVAWLEFADPEHFFETSIRPASGQFSKVPDDWSKLSYTGRPFVKTGYATYGLQILLPANNPELMLDFGAMYFAARIYVNGSLEKQLGRPGKSASEERASGWTGAGAFRIKEGSDEPQVLNLVVHLSNYVHAKGGFRVAMTLNEKTSYLRAVTFGVMTRIMFVGGALLLAIYHFILYFSRRKQLENFWFAAFLTIISVHGVCSLSFMNNIFPTANSEILMTLEYLSLTLGTYFAAMFLWTLYPETRWPPFYKIFSAYTLVISALIVFTGSLTFTAFLPVVKGGVLVMVIVGVGSTVYAVRYKLEGARLFLFSMCVMGGGLYYTIVMHSLIGKSHNSVAYFCMSFMLLAQAAILGRRITKAFAISEELGQSLHLANETLENKVIKRTSQLEKAVIDARAALLEARRATRAKSEFLAMMSHEVRTPLHGIIGMAELLGGTPINDKQGTYVEVIRQCGDDLLVVLNDILDISKVESGAMELEHTRVDFDSMLNRCMTLWKPRADEKKIALVRNFVVPEGLEIMGDQHRLLQIISNLVSNGIKFTETGEVRVEGSIICGSSGLATLALYVVDTGIGVPEEIREKIFFPFQQGDLSTTRNFGGTGLGLSICRQLTQLMGGTIEVDDNKQDGCGTSFSVLLNFEIADEVSKFTTESESKVRTG